MDTATIKDYYSILGVSKDATNEEIKKAFWSKAKQYHPDVSKHPEAHEKFIKIGEAYEILGNPDTRRDYDRIMAQGKMGDRDKDYGDFRHARRRAKTQAKTYAGMSLEDLVEEVLGFAFEMGRGILVGERDKPGLTLWDHVKLGLWGVLLVVGVALTFTGVGTIPGIMIFKAAFDVTHKNGKFLGFVPLITSTLAVGSVIIGALLSFIYYMINYY